MAYQKRVNIRAKKLVEKMAEVAKKKGGKLPAIRTMAREVGYSDNYADSGRIKKTEVWSELMEIYLPNSKLAKVHSDLLQSAEIQHYIFPKDTKKKKLTKDEITAVIESVPGCKLIYIKDDHYMGQVAFYQAPDSKSRKDALDMAHKLKGNYAPEQIEFTKRKYADLSNAELLALQTRLKNFLLKK